MMDKLAAMSTFVKVVESGSFTRAADALNLPKARVSQRVSDLEAELRVRLLHRTTRSLNLTDDGRAYFERCQSLLQQLDELEETLKGGIGVPAGKLRVEVLASIARWVIAPRLHEFEARCPRIQLRLGGTDRVSHLLEDGIDCAIRGGALKDSTLVARHLCDIRLGLYAAPAYLASAGAIQTPGDLALSKRLSWFNSRDRNPFSWELQSGPDTHWVEPAQGVQFDDPDVAIAACMAGSGICPGAPFAVRQFVMSGALVPVLPQWHFPARPIHLVYPSARHLSVRLRSFVNWVLEVFSSDERIALTPGGLAARDGHVPLKRPTGR